MFLLSSFAFAINGRTTYQAKIYKPDGLPLESVSVNFRFTVLDPSSSCVLYIEDYAAVNMIGSGGLTSFSLGMGTRSYPASGPTTFANVFDNSTPSFVCQAPGVYNPVPTDNRKIVMQFNDGGGWQTLPAMAINSVPYAMYAAKSQTSEKLNGKADTSFVEYSALASLNCQPSEAIQFNGANFACITVGSGVTSSSVTTALGYTPVNAVSFTAVSSTVSSLQGTLTSFQNTIAASFAALSGNTSSQWVSTGSDIYFTSGSVGVGTSAPAERLTVGAGRLAIINTAAWDHMALYHTGANAFYDIGGAEDGMIFRVDGSGGAGYPAASYTEAMRLMPTGRVGIGGVSNPTFTLEVSGAMRTGNASGSMTTGSDGNAYMELREHDNAGTPYIDFVNDNSNDYDARLILMNDDAVQLNGAFLGINILPTAGITIAQGTSTYAPLKFTSGTLLASPQSGTMEYDGSNFYLTDGANQRRTIATGSSQGNVDNVSQINSASNITLNPTGSVNVSSAMQVAGNLSTSGSLGVGQANPGEKLDVNGNMRLGNSDSNYLAFHGTNQDGAGSYNHTYIGERIYAPTESSELFLFKGNDSDNASGPDRIRMAGGNIVFDTYNTPDSPSGTFEGVATSPLISTKMIVKGNGNVGIGTTIPNYSLEVSGIVKASRGLYSIMDATNNNLPVWIRNQGSGDHLSIDNGSSEIFRITNAGNVGIGTPAPTVPLHVFTSANANITVQTSASGAGGAAVNLVTASTGGSPWQLVKRDDGYLGSPVGSFMINNSMSAPFLITSGGAVGVNTTNPQAQLDVNGVIRATSFLFSAPPGDPAPTISTRTVPAGQGAANEKTELILFHSNDFNNGAGNDQITLRAPALSFQTYASATVATIDDNGGYNERMYISPTGLVGIGTSSPVSALDLIGTQILHNSAADDQLVLGPLAAGLGANIYVTNSAQNTYAPMSLQASKFIFSQGNVGIGTSSPTTSLEVAGGDINVPTGKILFNSNTTSGVSGMAATDSGAIFGEHDASTETSRLVVEVYDNINDQIVLRTNAPSGGANVDMVKVQYDQVQLAPTTGNVGIGVAAPTSKLQVNGGIKQPNYGTISVIFDGTTRSVSMPAFLSDAYMNAHQDETFTWRAGGPTFKDAVGCNAGPNANYIFNNIDSTWAGTYRMTIGQVNGTNVVDIEWAGWGVNLVDAGFTVIPTNSNEGVVHATLANYASGWTIEHMGGQVGATPFACH